MTKKTQTKQKTKQKSKVIKSTKSVILPHKCPSCSAKANTMEQDTKIFGQRAMKGKDGKITIRSQSYCRKCRSVHHRQMAVLKSKKTNLAKVDLRTSKGISLKAGKATRKPKSKSKK